jgi:large subunit ribosomal protein L22
MAAVETPTEVKAEARYVRAAPRKAQLVAEQIRGRTVPEARTILAFMTRDAANDVEKVLNSAVANAEANHGLIGDELYVSGAYVGAGPTLKRWRARARGRVNRIRKRTCHITILLAAPEGAEAVVAPPAPTRAKPESAPGEETPKPRTRKPKEDEPAAEDAPAEETPAEEKPKRTRAAKPKAEAETAEKPKRTRAAKPKADATETESKPKRTTTRRKKTEEEK